MNILSLGATDIGEFCTSMAPIIRVIGWVLFIFKIAIPLIIIALGMFDFGKAVVAEKEDEIKKQTKRLLMRVVAGIVIFFIPNIVGFIFSMAVKEYDTDKDQIEVCETCFLHPNSCPE